VSLKRLLEIGLLAAVLVVIGVFVISAVLARDLGQWDEIDPKIALWFSTLMQPDNPDISCCGEADAWWADATEVKDGQTIAIITDDRDDEPLYRHHVPIGTRIIVPPNKIKFDRGNPTGHVVIFLSYDNSVYCYVMGGGV